MSIRYPPGGESTAFALHFTSAEERERLRHLLGRTGDDEGVARKDLEVCGRGGVGRFAAHDGDDGEAGDAALGGVAERLAGDVVFVVDGEPVDARARESGRAR